MPEPPERAACVVVITGVSGSGKSTVGRALAERLSWRFHDADDLHSPENVERMRRGLPLNDAMRAPWLARVRGVIEEAVHDRAGAVIACSALKARYRTFLSDGFPDVRFVFLHASRELLLQRLASRPRSLRRARLCSTASSTRSNHRPMH